MKRDRAPRRSLPDCAGRRFAVVVARFHTDIADLLVEGAKRALRDCNVPDGNVRFFNVPGCFELPLVCRNLIASKRFDALVALGAVIRGETSHYDLIAGECARGIMQVELATGVPIGFGVLTTENLAQALKRAGPKGGNKGYAAALTAATVLQELSTLGRI